MLQSKRLMLSTLERRFRLRQLESLRARVDHMRTETREAYRLYCESLLEWGSPESPDFWPIAYRRLVETADHLSRRLKGVADSLSSAERYQLATEVEMLEAMTDGWRSSITASMTSVV